MADRLRVVTVSDRLPAGLLGLAAWDALRTGPAYAPDLDSAPAQAVRAAGIELRRGIPTEGVVLLTEQEWADVELDAEVIVGSWDPPGARLLDVVSVIDRLLSDDGCPWDREQTHQSLMPYLLEETYEAYQALQDDDSEALREELGDVLFQIVFHSRIAPGWAIDDVAAGLAEKLVRRHPHVFGETEVSGADEVVANWHEIKRAEKQRASVLDGVPAALPALMLAEAVRRKAARAGVPADLLPSGDSLAARLFTMAADDAEGALHEVASRFRADVGAAETAARADGVDPAELDAEGWRRYWAR